MRCPNCNAEMEQGMLDLKAWGIGIAPQARLHFNEDLLLKNNYVPVVSTFTAGTQAPAFRCRICRLVCFQYVLPVKAEEPGAACGVELAPSASVA